MRTIKLTVASKKVTPSPPVGPTLGQAGLPIDLVCKELNVKTSKYKLGVPCFAKISVGKNKKYTIRIGGPSLGYLITKCTACDFKERKYITLKQASELSRHFSYQKNLPSRVTFRLLLGTLRSMGIYLLNDLRT